MKEKSIKLYNLIFPLWMLILFPVAWLIVVPLNYLIDSLVVGYAMRKCGMEDWKTKRKKVIIKVVVFGFLSDIIGGVCMMASQYMPYMFFVNDASWVHRNFSNPIMYNPFASIWAFLWVLMSMAIASVCIYFLNRKFTCKDMGDAVGKKISFMLALYTTPILFLLPTPWF